MIKIHDIEAYDVNEVAEILSLSPKTIRKYCNTGTIRAQKLGKKYYVLAEALQELLQPKRKRGRSKKDKLPEPTPAPAVVGE